MDQTAAGIVMKVLLANIHHKLQEAASIAKAAEAVTREIGRMDTAYRIAKLTTGGLFCQS